MTDTKYKGIRVDLDGVLYDLIAQFAKMDGYDYQGRWFEYIQSLNMTLHEYMKIRFDEFSEAGLFLNGNPCDGAFELVNYLVALKKKYNITIEILGALPHDKPYVNKVRCHKLAFLKKYRLYDKFDDIILCDGSRSKLNYADKKYILIDDFPKTKVRFDEAGAPMILYKNARDTINELANVYGLTV